MKSGILPAGTGNEKDRLLSSGAYDDSLRPVIIQSLDQFRQGTCRMPGGTQNNTACAVGNCVVEDRDVFKMSVKQS